jgi:4-amino-4-deoxy-L-arabinose transferase-like glycosyltransferase
LLVALATRVAAALAVGSGLHFPDEAIYVDAARRLSMGGGFGLEYKNVPGYPVFLVVLSLGTDASVLYFRVAQGVVAAAGTLVVLALADRMFGQRAAIVAGTLYALDPLLVVSSGLLYPETVAALLVPLVVLGAYRGIERDALGISAAAGLLLGLLALLRPVALVLPLVVAGWIALASRVKPSRTAAHIGVLGLCVVIALLPWTVRGYRVHGRLIPVATAGSDVVPAGADGIERDGVVSSMAGWAWREPTKLVSHVAGEFLHFWELRPTRVATDDAGKRAEFQRQDPRLSNQQLFARGLRDLVSIVSFGLELAFALVGLVLAMRSRRRLSLLPLAMMLAYAVGYSLFVAKLRYRIPVLPLLFAFTALGVTGSLALIAKRASELSRPA